ncbi:MAG: hypothetical protein WC335_06325 [Candidatus Omnitrophota bacterium]|jgi:hypothetical protein
MIIRGKYNCRHNFTAYNEKKANRGGKGGVFKMQAMSIIRRDFAANNLRRQLDYLHNIVDNLGKEKVDGDRAGESLREIENNLRQIRKLCINN